MPIKIGRDPPDVRRAPPHEQRPSNVVAFSKLQQSKHTQETTPFQPWRGAKIANPARGDQEARAASLRLVHEVQVALGLQLSDASELGKFLQAAISALTSDGHPEIGGHGLRILSAAIRSGGRRQ